MAIGRDAFNALYRVFKRKTLTVALKVRFYESFVIGTLHGSHGWIFGGAVIRRLNGWSARMLSTITGRSIRSETKQPSVAVTARLVAGQMKTIGAEMRQSDEYPARVALLRTRLHIELKLQQPENTLLGYTLQAMWGDSIPSAEAMITAAGGHYDQTPTAVMSRKTAAMAAANVILKNPRKTC